MRDWGWYRRKTPEVPASRNERKKGKAQGRWWEKAVREGMGCTKGQAAFLLIYPILEVPFKKNNTKIIDIKLITGVNIYLE